MRQEVCTFIRVPQNFFDLVKVKSRNNYRQLLKEGSRVHVSPSTPPLKTNERIALNDELVRHESYKLFSGLSFFTIKKRNPQSLIEYFSYLYPV